MSKQKLTWKIIATKQIGRSATFGGGDGQFAFVTPCREVHYTLYQT